MANAQVAAITAPDLTMINGPVGYIMTVNRRGYALMPDATLDPLGPGPTGITDFILVGRDRAPMLDPTDPLAFMLGITPVNASDTQPLSMSQTPFANAKSPLSPAVAADANGAFAPEGPRRTRWGDRPADWPDLRVFGDCVMGWVAASNRALPDIPLLLILQRAAR